MACSVYGAQYLLEGLYKAGASDYALDLITSTEGDRNWWNMIRSGSTMTLEAWDMRYKPNLDWNHAWGSAPLNIIPRYIWGITPAEPGFAKVKLQPKMGHLTSSEIKLPTQHGPIFGTFEKHKTKTTYVLTLPVGVSGEFIPPAPTKQEVLLNGKATDNTNLIQLQGGENVIEFY
jgi:hypothetical protein